VWDAGWSLFRLDLLYDLIDIDFAELVTLAELISHELLVRVDVQG
jgi:hypothetical protein